MLDAGPRLRVGMFHTKYLEPIINLNPTYSTEDVCLNPTKVGQAGAHLRALYHGAASLEPRPQSLRLAVYGFTNSYNAVPGVKELRGAERDRERLKKWCSTHASDLRFDYLVIPEADKAAVESTLISCSQGKATLCYFNGHIEMLRGERMYITGQPSDRGMGQTTEDLYIPLARMRNLLLGTPISTKLVLVSDICCVPNFLGLPYVARRDARGIWAWEKTDEYESWMANSQNQGKSVLHFAATDESGVAYEWGSIGGIFTREFCNVEIWESLRARLDTMHAYISPFVYKYANKGVQHPELYSSHEIDFEDRDALKKNLGMV